MTSKAGQQGSRVVPFERTDDDTLCTIEEVPALVPCKEVEAVCRDVEKVYYSPYQQEKWVFKFSVVVPEQYAGNVVPMFVRVVKSWKTPPKASKLFKIACVASGGLRKGQLVTKSMFLNKMFRCQLRQSGKGPAAYTVVEKILEKLTG